MTTAQRAPALLVLCVLAAIAVGHLARTQAFEHYAATQRYEDVYYLPSPKVLITASAGHREALADLLWIRANLYFSDELLHHGDKENLLRYGDAVLALDPYFARVYRWLGTLSLYRAGTPTQDDMLDAVEYLKRGAALFPDDGDLAYTLGATYAYELIQFAETEEERDRLQALGSDYLRIAVLKGKAPAWLASSTARYFERAGRKEDALRHLREVYAVASGEDREKLAARIRQLEGEAYLEQLRAHQKAFEAGHRDNYPYLDPGLFALVGERRAEDDLTQLRLGFDPFGQREDLPSDARETP